VLRNKLYYRLKPLLPGGLRLFLRRTLAKRQRRSAAGVWPVYPGSEKLPEGWPGWPEGKKFALVLTHDVEGQEGLEKCRPLMELEKKMGLRSSFHFVPEGDYRVSEELREELTKNGFEIGVHDLYHDGQLFSSRNEFKNRAGKINRYLKEWKATGFRSGFMLRDLQWIGELNISYDASTFDTDPFEPQPDGVHTIFPFWVSNSDGGGYVELPYTVPQDSTLFVYLQEKSIDIWKKKVDWICEHGGMALVDVHPDYINFQGQESTGWEYPVGLYEEFLKYIQTRHAGNFWHALPRDVAAWVATTRNKGLEAAANTSAKF
jgi:hypothetical protein